jgi:hypothetical protein
VGEEFSLDDDQMHTIVRRVYGSPEDVSAMLTALRPDQRIRWYPGNVRRLLNRHVNRSEE